MSKKKYIIPRSDGGRLKILVYSPDSEPLEPRTGVLWIHGGGYINGMAEMDGMMGMGPRLVRGHDCVVVSPEYRLRAEGRYPNAIEDCYDALRNMVTRADELGIRKDQIFVGGESAGGGLCAALCMLARDRGEFHIAFQMPLYPMIDDRDTESSRQTDYSNLPPAYTFVCSKEPFLCETVEFVDRLKKAGVDAEIDVYEGLYHAFDMLQPWRKESKIAIRRFEEVVEKAKKNCFAKN